MAANALDVVVKQESPCLRVPDARRAGNVAQHFGQNAAHLVESCLGVTGSMTPHSRYVTELFKNRLHVLDATSLVWGLAEQIANLTPIGNGRYITSDSPSAQDPTYRAAAEGRAEYS